MEELQSTEALDREILEDARKKAFKILKDAASAAVSSAAQWERKFEGILEKTKASYAKKTEQGKAEIMARLPMDKRRVRSEKIEGFLDKTMNAYLAGLDRKKILLLLEKELMLRSDECEAEGTCELRYRKLSAGELAALLKKCLPQADKFRDIRPLEDALFNIPGSFPALVLDFPALRITASVDAAANALLLDKRAELVSALLGEEAVNE